MSNHADSNGQPAPKGSGRPVVLAVVQDLCSRAEYGEAKYGTLLRADNGRRAKIDAYQEALDLVMYLKQDLMEDHGVPVVEQRATARLDHNFSHGLLVALVDAWLAWQFDETSKLYDHMMFLAGEFQVTLVARNPENKPVCRGCVDAKTQPLDKAVFEFSLAEANALLAHIHQDARAHVLQRVRDVAQRFIDSGR